MLWVNTGTLAFVIDFAAAGLGLPYGTVRLVRADAEWANIARHLAAEISAVLGDVALDVEHIGSTAVPGLLAKPIVDLALALPQGTDVGKIAEPLSGLGWIYRGDMGDHGGWVFVLDDSPWHRVAHVHGVVSGGSQWVRYLQFRDLLRRSAAARKSYEDVKERLAALYHDARDRYTAGKDATVQLLLATSE